MNAMQGFHYLMRLGHPRSTGFYLSRKNERLAAHFSLEKFHVIKTNQTPDRRRVAGAG